MICRDHYFNKSQEESHLETINLPKIWVIINICSQVESEANDKKYCTT